MVAWRGWPFLLGWAHKPQCAPRCARQPRGAQRRDSQVRNRFWTKLALVLGAAAALGIALLPQGSAQANQGSAQANTVGGDFIVRCFFTGPTQPMDPILDPGSTTTAHLHIFFGNMIQGTTSFPTIKSGDNGGSGATMESNGRSPQTNCQDSQDTAGYWMPAPYVNGQAYTAGGPCSSNCKAATNMHLRVYYLPTVGSVAYDEIPDGTIMVTGYPDGCKKNTTVNPAISPPGCTYPSPSYPNDLSLVRYTCGDSAGNTIMTPVSAWPYNCANYRDLDDSFNDGIVAIVDFPQCWNGQADWPAPNDSSHMVPGYVAPWIPDPGAPPNDFAYATNGICPPAGQPSYNIPVVQLEERFHPLTANPQYADETAFGEPSTCYGNLALTKKWNDPAVNAEWGDKDGHTTHPCNPASGPKSTSDLSFACNPATSGGDGNCSVALQSPASCNGGTCWIGAPRYGFETLHADYWQTWVEGTGNMQGVGTDTIPDLSQGAFRDLVEDCVNNGPGSCSFINNIVQPPIPNNGRVFTASPTTPETPS